MRTNDKYESGSAIFFIIILLAVIGGGLYFLESMRKSAIAEGEQFARQVIDRCAFQHDAKFLSSVVAAERRLQVPPAMDAQFVDMLAKLGSPNRNYQLTGSLQFESYFFSPHGSYQTVLTYPDRHATMYMTIARPSGIWLVTDYGITWERPPE